MQGLVEACLFVGGQNAGTNQRLRVGPAARDVFPEKSAIDRQRPCEAVDQRVRFFLEAPTPGLLAQCVTFAIRLARPSQDKPAIWAAGPQSC